MNGHLDSESLASWRKRPDAVRHLGECAACRDLVNVAEGIARLEPALIGRDEHPQYHHLEALVDGEADPVAHDLLLFHLSKCETCAGEYRDLAAFRAELGEKARKPWVVRWALPASAALAAIALVAVYVERAPKTSAPPAATVRTASLNTSLHDAGTTIGLDATGAFRGLDKIPTNDRELLREVLQSQTLPVSAEAARLKRAREVRLGGEPAPAPTFEPAGPAGTVVPEQSPRFHWGAPAGARNFIVSVYTTDFEPVVKSHTLATNEWTANQSLEDGRTYVWTVSAEIDGKRVTVPAAPEPEALFRVATAAEREELRDARSAAPGCALLEATVAARLGMMDVARQAMAKLEATNQGSPVVASLDRQLTTK